MTAAKIVRSWQLPLALDAEAVATADVIELAGIGALSEEDYTILLEEDTDLWASTGSISALLLAAMDAALRHVPPSISSVDARAYRQMYTRLRDGTADEAGLSHAVAQRLLSRAALIAHLMSEDRFSCSQVARLLAATEARLTLPFGSVRVIARGLNQLPALNIDSVTQLLWDQDQARSLTMFPDSDLIEAAQTAADEISAWLPEVDVKSLLVRLSKAEQPQVDVTWPYLQMLHWCLTPIEFYDHPATYLYEFAPRGRVASELFARYPIPTGNPFLNNAKALERLTWDWARSRGGDDAHALVDLVTLLEALPYLPRRTIAQILRGWLMRVIELRTISPMLLDSAADMSLFDNFIDDVVTNDTNTQGVIEQRVVDCLAVLAYQQPGWRARGLGDGVNASNLSRRKLGDVEFTKVDSRSAVALEAHGGFLSAAYVADHQRSLSRILDQRLRESWADLDEASAWTVTVVFIAHGRAQVGLPTNESLHEVNVVYKYMDYGELVALARSRSSPAERVAAFRTHVIDALNKRTVRESARERYRSILLTFEGDSQTNGPS